MEEKLKFNNFQKDNNPLLDKINKLSEQNDKIKKETTNYLKKIEEIDKINKEKEKIINIFAFKRIII